MGLGEEGPVIGLQGGRPAHALPVVERRDDVEQDHAVDHLGRVEGEPVGDAGAAVVAHDGEAIEAERLHDGDAVARHGALGIGRVVVAVGGRCVGEAVAAQVHDDDGRLGGQLRGEAVPAGVRLRVAVKAEKRWPVAGDAAVKREPVVGDEAGFETGKEVRQVGRAFGRCHGDQASRSMARQPMSRRQKPSGQSSRLTAS